jgi:hypothetical protein
MSVCLARREMVVPPLMETAVARYTLIVENLRGKHKGQRMGCAEER